VFKLHSCDAFIEIEYGYQAVRLYSEKWGITDCSFVNFRLQSA